MTEPSVFQRCVDWVLDWETERLTDFPHDRGGATRWGISQRANPDVDVVTLSRQGAAEIYSERYWLPLRCHQMAAPIAMTVFDHAVHVSQGAAATNLQVIVRANPDGVVGFKTLARLERVVSDRGARQVALELLDRRADLQVDAFRARNEWITMKGFVSRWLAVCAFAQSL